MQPDTPRPGFFSRVLQHAWIDLPPLVRGEKVVSLSRKEAKLWTLILASRHVPYRMAQLPTEQGGGYTVQVQ